MQILEGDVILPSQGDNIIRTKNYDDLLNPKGLAHELYNAMKINSNKIAQIDAESGVKETFDVVLERSIRIACHLKKLGVTTDDIISPCTTNHLNTSPLFYATLFVGAKPASMDPFAPDEDSIKQLELVKPKFVFAIEETVNALEDMIEKLELDTKIVVFGESKNHIPFSDFLVELPEEESSFTPHLINDIHNTAMIVFSSGTTGLPKGICISHGYSLNFISRSVAGPLVTLSHASLVWVSAIVLTCCSAGLGQIKICASGFEPKKTWDYFKKYEVNICFLAPQEITAMLQNPRPKGLELPHLQMIIPAGGALSLESTLKAREVFANATLFVGYGQTESGLVLAPDLSTPEGVEEYKNKPTMCGEPMKGITYKIVDPESEEVRGPNQPGEIRVKIEFCMSGYYKANSNDRFDDDGFLKTGDILYYDQDYCFYFVERLKEMLRYKMVAIAPTELEGILIQHPSVKVAVVVGIPTDEGDLATAVIVKNDENVTAKELEDLVASKVDDRKRLRGGVRFVNEEYIPVTPTGKIRRKALTQKILSLNQNKYCE